MPPVIQRTWGVVFTQWSEWSKNDPDAQLLLEMLGDLGKALSVNQLQPGVKVAQARKIFTKWNIRNTVKSSERDLMRAELVQALKDVENATLDSILGHGNEPLEKYGKNVYPVKDTDSELKPSKSHLKSAEGIAAFKGTNLVLRGLPLNTEVMDAIFKQDQVKSILLVNCKYPEGWRDDIFGLLLEMRKLVFYGCNRAAAPGFMLEPISQNFALRILELIMADFLHHRKCYESLGQMHQLTTLNLARTLTYEKTPSGGRELAMKAMKELIAHGDLIELNLSWCTALKRPDLVNLAEALSKKGGRLIISEQQRTLEDVQRQEGRLIEDGSERF